MTAVRATAGSELRRRLMDAYREESIGTGRWDAPMPMPVAPPDASPLKPDESKDP